MANASPEDHFDVNLFTQSGEERGQTTPVGGKRTARMTIPKLEKLTPSKTAKTVKGGRSDFGGGDASSDSGDDSPVFASRLRGNITTIADEDDVDSGQGTSAVFDESILTDSQLDAQPTSVRQLEDAGNQSDEDMHTDNNSTQAAIFDDQGSSQAAWLNTDDQQGTFDFADSASQAANVHDDGVLDSPAGMQHAAEVDSEEEEEAAEGDGPSGEVIVDTDEEKEPERNTLDEAITHAKRLNKAFKAEKGINKKGCTKVGLRIQFVVREVSEVDRRANAGGKVTSGGAPIIKHILVADDTREMHCILQGKELVVQVQKGQLLQADHCYIDVSTAILRFYNSTQLMVIGGECDWEAVPAQLVLREEMISEARKHIITIKAALQLDKDSPRFSICGRVVHNFGVAGNLGPQHAQCLTLLIRDSAMLHNSVTALTLWNASIAAAKWKIGTQYIVTDLNAGHFRGSNNVNGNTNTIALEVESDNSIPVGYSVAEFQQYNRQETCRYKIKGIDYTSKNTETFAGCPTPTCNGKKLKYDPSADAYICTKSGCPPRALTDTLQGFRGEMKARLMSDPAYTKVKVFLNSMRIILPEAPHKSTGTFNIKSLEALLPSTRVMEVYGSITMCTDATRILNISGLVPTN